MNDLGNAKKLLAGVVCRLRGFVCHRGPTLNHAAGRLEVQLGLLAELGR